MTEEKENRARGIQRYNLVSPRTYSFDVIAFDQPVRIEYEVQILDFSVVGVGIESSALITPGLVCFREPVGGQKFGVVVWSTPKGDQYRTGIRFVTLPSEKEAYLHEQIKQAHPLTVLHDPDKIIATLLETIKKETKE